MSFGFFRGSLPGMKALDAAAAFRMKRRAGYGVVELTEFHIALAALLCGSAVT